MRIELASGNKGNKTTDKKAHKQSLTSTGIISQDAKVMPPKYLTCMYLKIWYSINLFTYIQMINTYRFTVDYNVSECLEIGETHELCTQEIIQGIQKSK